MVEADSNFNCYTTHEAYAIHEDYHIDFAKQKFNAHRIEAEKKKKIVESIDSVKVYNYPLESRDTNRRMKRLESYSKSQNKDDAK